MSDLLYPDNPKREKRVDELSDDIATLVYDLSLDAAVIKRTLAELDEIIQAMYKKIEVDLPAHSTKKVDFHGWVVDVFEGLEPFVIYPIAKLALEKAAVSWLLGEGRLGEAALADIAGLPTWLKVGVTAGGVIVVIGIELSISAISGAVKRDKLRDAIHSAISPRITLKKAAIINDMLKEKLEAVLDSVNTMRELGYTEKQLDEVQKKLSMKFKEEVDKVTDETAVHDLAELDRNRGSWTNED